MPAINGIVSVGIRVATFTDNAYCYKLVLASSLSKNYHCNIFILKAMISEFLSSMEGLPI
jgi:hypothetical protein